MGKDKGFSLLEILVAFSILAISLGILLKIFSSGLNTAIISEDYIIATQIAESLMAKSGIEEPLTIGETSGVEAEKYHWKVSVENFVNPIVEEEKASVEFMDVQVVVEWGEHDKNRRTVELNSVMIGPGSNAAK